MAERSEILTQARSLQPQGRIGAESPEEFAVWKGAGHGARFELSKAAGWVAYDMEEEERLVLELRGRLSGQERLEQEFTEVFGIPLAINPSRRFKHPRTLVWYTDLALREFRFHEATDFAGQVLDGLIAGQRLFPKTLIPPKSSS